MFVAILWIHVVCIIIIFVHNLPMLWIHVECF